MTTSELKSPPAQPLLVVEGLRVDYEDITAVDDVSFSIDPGMVYGLIGPNGAGKTSIIRVLATLLEPTYGRVQICGTDLLLEPKRALQHIGYMPDFPPLYEDLTVREFLELYASAYGLPIPLRAARIAELVEWVTLTEKLDQPCGGLSRGMKQRLFLAKTLLHDPAVLLLDEPASGLDPRARLEFRDIIVALGKKGKAVLVSSHILSEMADFCNAVGIMEQGKMKVSGRVDRILEQLQPYEQIAVRLARADDRLGGFLATIGGATEVQVSGDKATFRFVGDADQMANLLKALIMNEFHVIDFHSQTGNLQDIFLKVSAGRVS